MAARKLNTKPRRYIETLTKEQEARMPEWRDRWIAWGLATGRADREKVERGINASYAFAGLERPKRIVWVESPAILAVVGPTAAAVLELRRRGALAPSHDAVRGAVRGAVGDAVGDAVDGADACSGAARVVLDTINAGWGYRLGGRWWAGGWWWGLAWQSYFRDVVKLEFISSEVWERANAHEDMMSAGWLWPHKDFCIVSELPSEIHLEAATPAAPIIRRLHNASGPAIAWADGVSIYFVHGVRIDDPEWILDRSKLTHANITMQSNAEVRRVMIEFYGADRYVRDSGSKLVDSSEFGKLWRRELSDDEPLQMVELVDSTPIHGTNEHKTYFLRVPPTVRTAREAVAWTFEMPAAEMYAPAIQT